MADGLADGSLHVFMSSLIITLYIIYTKKHAVTSSNMVYSYD